MPGDDEQRYVRLTSLRDEGASDNQVEEALTAVIRDLGTLLIMIGKVNANWAAKSLGLTVRFDDADEITVPFTAPDLTRADLRKQQAARDREIIRAVKCLYCGAGKGRWCWLRGWYGTKVKHLHKARLKAYEAWLAEHPAAGREEGSR